MSRFSRLALLLFATALMATAAPAAAENPTATPSRHCSEGSGQGYGTNYIIWIHNRNVSCRRARRLVREFHACRPGPRGRCPRVSGYSCRENRDYGRGSFYSVATCTRGSKLVKHQYNQWL